MPASFPGSIFSPRTIANRSGVIYDPDDTKTLFKEDVDAQNAEIIALETELTLEMAEKSGWIQKTVTWSCGATDVLTVPSGAGAIFAVGDKIMLYQNSAWKYFYVIAVADTALTLTGGADYSLVNGQAISAGAYSHAESPIYFPQYFTLTNPTWSRSGTGFTNNPTVVAFRFQIKGRMIFVELFGYLGNPCGGTGTIYATRDLPVSIVAGECFYGSVANDNKAFGGRYNDSSSRFEITYYDGSALTGNSYWFSLKLMSSF